MMEGVMKYILSLVRLDQPLPGFYVSLNSQWISGVPERKSATSTRNRKKPNSITCRYVTTSNENTGSLGDNGQTYAIES